MPNQFYIEPDKERVDMLILADRIAKGDWVDKNTIIVV